MKEYRVITHGNLELLEDRVNEALSYGWNLMGYVNFLNGQWVQSVTRVKSGDKSVEEACRSVYLLSARQVIRL